MENSYSLDELPKVAEEILGHLTQHTFVTFNGEMGAGKTTLILHLLKRLGISDPEGSPTYSIINQYELPGQKKLYHIDAYRIKHDDEAEALGLDELFSENAIFFVEWAEKIVNFLPERRMVVTIETTSMNQRQYSLSYDH
jgi:tRNA threonylcarbamoyladenosine biosynthesis protein TsaE